MKILVLMKRFGANKDMPVQNFGRQIRLFENLAGKHKIDFLCLDYKLYERKNIEDGGITYYIVPFSKLGLFRFLKEADKLVKEKGYDIIVGSTEPIISIIAWRMAKRNNAKFLYEMQDSYTTYAAYKIPFVSHFDRKAIKDADAVVCVSQTLQKEISKINSNTYNIENGIEIELFVPMDKKECRKKLSLGENDKIICYIGHVTEQRGISVLLEAFRLLSFSDGISNLKLLLSGKIEDDIKQIISGNENIIIMELPDRGDVVHALNAADVLVIPNVDNEFTRYSFPYKLMEYMATNTPIVATRVGDMGAVLAKFPDTLCEPDNAEEMSEKIKKQLSRQKQNYRKTAEKYGWKMLSEKLGRIIDSL